MKTCLQLIVVGALALAANASAATIVGLDVANTVYTGVGVLDTTSRTWTTTDGSGNFVLDGASIHLVNSGFGAGSSGAPTIGLFQNYLHSGTSISLSGLDNTKLYSIVLYSADVSAQGASWTLATGTYGGAATRISTGSQTATFVEGQNYVRFDNITSSAGGVISFNLANDGSGAPIFNAFEISVVPEPSAALLGGLGVLALLRRRRN